MRRLARLRPYADLLLGVGLALLLTLEVIAYPRAEVPEALPGCVLVGAGTYLRRRQPVAALVVTILGLAVVDAYAPDLDGESLAFILGYLVAHYSVGRWAVGREAVLAVPVVTASMVVFAIGDARDSGVPLSQIDPASIGFALGFVGGPWAAGLALRLRRERERLLDAENRRLQQEQEEVARRAVAAERSRIARELHDVVSHAIAVTVLQARGARATLERHPQQARDALDAIEHTNTQALSDMRRLLAVLRDTEDEPAEDQSHAPQPSLASLEALVDRVCAAGAPVRLEIVGDPGPVPPGVDLSAYRIVQEALTNVLKHAGGAHTTIRLRYGVDALGIAVVDDGGTGAHGDTRASANGRRVGHGLIGIRERVAVIGGEVSAGPRPEGGFEVNARLPYSLEVP